MKVAGERLLGWARVLSGARVRAMEPTPPGAVLAALQLQAAQQQAVYMQAAQRALQQQQQKLHQQQSTQKANVQAEVRTCERLAAPN